ncbi:hypothetical protein CAEBREN_19019 [Caenorhabditis brenneri]|uniref:Uncharacterized protein n=1 Tax=Caenorhabditis brenneri TaxID=135651 RepID=G0NXC6_CAEBE|nr:hypothetical protein CAEBREN_19019 [Caenorhabditis brenneri]
MAGYQYPRNIQSYLLAVGIAVCCCIR